MKRYVECMEVREEFSALLDGELGSEEREQIEAHLSECADCLRELNALKQVDDLYGALDSVSAPAGFEEKVQQAIRPRILRFPDWAASGSTRWMRPMAAMAALLLVMFGAIYALGPESADRFQTASGPESGRLTMTGDTLMETAESLNQSRFSVQEEATSVPKESVAVLPEDAKKPASDGAWDTLVRVQSNPAGARMRTDVAEREVPRKKVESSAVGGTLEDTVSEKLDVQRAVSNSPAPAPALRAPTAQEVDRLQSLGYVDDGRVARGAEDSDVAVQSEARKARNEVLGTPSRELMEADESFEVKDQRATAASPTATGIDDFGQMDQRIEELVEQVKTEGRAIESVQLPSYSIAADGTWIQKGYEDQALTKLARGSRALSELTSRNRHVQKIAKRSARTIFVVAGKWYVLEAEQETN